MATRYNLEAERKQDYVIEETPNVPYDQWLQTVNRPGPFQGPWRDPAQITNKIDLPPRVIRLHLRSKTAAERTETALTWALSFPQAENLRPGTVVHWADVRVDGNTTGWIEVALSGIRTTALNTNTNEPYTFIAGANTSVTLATAGVTFDSSTPVAATCLDLDILNSGRVTLHNLSSTFQLGSNISICTTLVFIEPGATIWG